MAGFKKFLHTTLTIFKIYWEIAPWLTTGVLVTQVLLSFQSISNAYIFAIVLDRLILLVTDKSISVAQIFPIVLLYIATNFLISILGAINGYFNGLLSTFDVSRLRLKQTDFMVTLGISQLESPDLTNVSTRYSETYSSMNQHLTMLVGLVAIVVSSIVSGLIVVSLAPTVVFLFLIFFVLKFVSNGRFMNKVWRLYRDNTEERRMAWASIGVLADPASVKELMISGGVPYLRLKFNTYVDWYYNSYFKIRTKWSLVEVLQTFVDVALYGLGIFIVIQKGMSGFITVGAITFYIKSLGTFSDQLDSLSYRVARAIESSIRLQDALELFEKYMPEKDGTVTLGRSVKPPLIKLLDVSFTYPNGSSPVLEHLSLTIKPGEKIAIVGENGAGKTTLVKLITRIYSVGGGSVFIDNVKLSEIKIKSWHRKLGVLFQDFNTYSHMTVEENIKIGKIGHKDGKTKLVDASQKSDALDFINKYPNKFNQILSERFKGGIRPSTGQWQKIAIARFFYRNAPVLILDEPTASIDAVSEAKIFDNIYKFMKGKTVIIISHRFSTVRNADRIIVLDKGKIIEDGSHEELLAKGGKYAKSFKLQAKGYF